MSKKNKAASSKAARANNPNAVPIEIRENGELVTKPGLEAYGAPLRAIKSLDPFQLAAGIMYGAICEDLESSGIGTQDFLSGGRGNGGGCEGSVDRRLKFRAMQDRARVVLASLDGMTPKRAARKAKGDADLGPVHKSCAPGGAIIDRKEITARRLVDMVCIGECSVRQVLVAHGWAVSSCSRKTATAILSRALSEIASDWGGGIARGHRSV